MWLIKKKVKPPYRIVIFASGEGTNAQRVIQYGQRTRKFEVVTILCNNPKAGVLRRANELNVPVVLINQEEFRKTRAIINMLITHKTDLVVLAGFLWLIPPELLHEFPTINIHPSLLPKYGGRGMYGNRVHQAVIASQEKETGITIHCVNERYDEGEVLFRAYTRILPTDTVEEVAAKVHALEYKYFPRVIEEYLKETVPR